MNNKLTKYILLMFLFVGCKEDECSTYIGSTTRLGDDQLNNCARALESVSVELKPYYLERCKQIAEKLKQCK